MLDLGNINSKVQIHRLKLRKGYQNLARGKKKLKMLLSDCNEFLKLTLIKWAQNTR